MFISIKSVVQSYGIDGDIILYRDKEHKKAAMCRYLATEIETDRPICVCTGGAFGLYISRAFHNNRVISCGFITDEYLKQIRKLGNAETSQEFLSLREESVKVLTPAVKKWAESKNYYFIDQFSNELIPKYYKEHFADIAKELHDISIDAFCDCGHSCATMAGYLDSGLSWKAILGVNTPTGERACWNHLLNRRREFITVTTLDFDTKEIQAKIESKCASFGNIFEATRSISAAMKWLQDNPGKTVLVYVGDSQVFGEADSLK